MNSSPRSHPPSSSGQHQQDLELARQAIAGNRPSLDAIADMLLPRVHGACRRLLSNPDDAREASQDVMLRILTRLKQFDGRSSLVTWATRVAMNHCLSLRRRQVLARNITQVVVQQSLATADAHRAFTAGVGHRKEPSSASGVKSPEFRDQLGALAAAWDTLEAEAAGILLLRDIQELDYETIAEILNIPLGTVKSRLFRARASLRQAIERIESSTNHRPVVT